MTGRPPARNHEMFGHDQSIMIQFASVLINRSLTCTAGAELQDNDNCQHQLRSVVENFRHIATTE